MKLVSDNFKFNIKEMGRELDSIITYTEKGEKIELGNSELNSVTPIVQTSLLKSVMKELDIDSNIDIPLGAKVNFKFGVSLNNSDYEYINFGNYIVKSSEKREDTNSFNIVCYDSMLGAMTDYEKLQTDIKTFPMTVRDYIDCICADLGLFFKNKNGIFANYNRIIESDLYAELGYTYRDVLDELAQVTASNIIINENDELEIKYITDTNETLNEEYLKDVNVSFGEKYGPVNSIVLSRSAESDNIYLQDEESVEKNGLHELKIKDNQIMNFNNRDEYLPDILQKLNGLEFYINDFSSIGICFLDVCDKYSIQVDDNIYQCILFNDEISITQGLTENIHTDMPEESVTDYTKSDKTDRRIDQAYLIVDKQNRKIESFVSETTEEIKKIDKKVDNVSANFEDFKDNEYIQSIENLQDQIDGAIQFWNGPEIPTLNNYPANNWTTENERNNHRADIYTVIEDIQGELKQGKSYRFDKVDGQWQWIELTDNELSAVQALAQDALNKANQTDQKLQEDYYTKTETNSQIIQTANSIQQNVTAQITDAEGNILKEVDGKLELYIEKGDTDEVVSALNLAVNKLKINSDNFKLTEDGYLTCKGATLTDGKLEVSDSGEYADPCIKIKSTRYGYYIVENTLNSHFIRLNNGYNSIYGGWLNEISSDMIIMRSKFDGYENTTQLGDGLLSINNYKDDEETFISSRYCTIGNVELGPYNSSEKITFDMTVLNGFITSSTASLKFSVTTPRSLAYINNIKCSQFYAELRGISGYLNNTAGLNNYANVSGYTISCKKASDNLIVISIDKTSAFTNVTNNTIISAYGNVTLELS